MDCGQRGGVRDSHTCASRFSVSNDLKYDAERDLRDIDAQSVAVHALSKVGGGATPGEGLGPRRLRPHVAPLLPQIKYGDNTASEGVLFATYSALIGESQAGGQHRTRIRQILEWCGEAFDGVVSWLRAEQGRRRRGGGREQPRRTSRRGMDGSGGCRWWRLLPVLLGGAVLVQAGMGWP